MEEELTPTDNKKLNAEIIIIDDWYLYPVAYQIKDGNSSFNKEIPQSKILNVNEFHKLKIAEAEKHKSFRNHILPYFSNHVCNLKVQFSKDVNNT